MGKNTKKICAIAAWVVIGFGLSQCEKKATDEEETPASTTTSTEPSTFSTTTTSTNISAVESGMIPGSLAVPASTGLKLQGSNPCAGTNGFFDCQPNLLKVYLGMGKNMVSMVSQIVTNVGPAIEKFGAGAKGSVEMDAGDDFSKIDYDITDSANFKILMHVTAGPALYLSVADGHYEVIADIGLMPDADKGGKLHSVIEYTDDTHFTVATNFFTEDCDPTDVRAPQNFDMNIARAGDVWKGKAMLYMPRWATAGDPTCDMVPTDTSKLGFYTDFVGDDAVSTASIYFIPYTTTSLASIETFAVSNLCSNWSGLCNNGYGFGDSSPVSSYGNAFCIDKAASSTTWKSACSSTNTDISTPVYSDASNWKLPSEVANPTITMPTAL